MVDTQDPFTDTHDPISDTPPIADELPGDGQPTGGRPTIDVQGMLGQLQSMIGKVAAASEPRLREVAAKAAELAAVAAEHAGPIAHTLADKTDNVSHAVAEKASAYASSIRSRGEAPTEAGGPDVPASSDPAWVGDPAEDSPRDGA